MAQIARPEADKAAGQAENVVRSGFQSVRQAADAAAEAERKTAHRAGDGVAEINQSLVELLTEQTKHNVQLFQALAQPANWGKGKAAQLQSEFLRTSWQRVGQFTRRYVEVSQDVMTSTLPTARGQARKAV